MMSITTNINKKRKKVDLTVLKSYNTVLNVKEVIFNLLQEQSIIADYCSYYKIRCSDTVVCKSRLPLTCPLTLPHPPPRRRRWVN